MTNTVPLSSRIYGRLLVLYPEDLRRDYGAEMALIFAEDLATARREAGIRGVIRTWRCALSEFVRFALLGHASSSAVRVAAISVALFIAMMSGATPVALRQSPGAPTFFEPLRVILLLPLFCTPLISWSRFGLAEAVESFHWTCPTKPARSISHARSARSDKAIRRSNCG